ncbi:MAG: hypothetical protein SR2Q5_00835 [Quinella sp. 2Q5]|nr:hypothetical protein [Quinella sp. 2Q5]
MRKIFFALMLTLLMTFTTVNAQDVWICSDDNDSAWYIVDETIEGGSGKFSWANVRTKMVETDGSCVGVTWQFTKTNPDGGRLANWVYVTVWDNAPNPEAEVLPGTNAEKILRHCLNHLGL